jgi:hypothetical protein
VSTLRREGVEARVRLELYRDARPTSVIPDWRDANEFDTLLTAARRPERSAGS